MKIPETIKIGGKIFEVIFADRYKEHGSVKNGTVLGCHQKIWIDTTTHQECQESTLLHEILEAIDEMNELGIEHSKLCVLETALYQVFKDNKCFINEAGKEEGCTCDICTGATVQEKGYSDT